MIEDPDPGIAPVILPVMVPIVQAKLLGKLEVKAIFVLIPLQEFTNAAFVTMGFGSTDTTIE